MARKKKTEAAVEAPANPDKIVWPTDTYGITSELKKAIKRAASRIGSSEPKAELLKEVLRIGALHMDAKVVSQKDAAVKARAGYASRQAARNERELVNVAGSVVPEKRFVD